MQKANENAAAWGKTYDQLVDDKREIETQYRLRPDLLPMFQQQLLGDEQKRREKAAEELLAKQGQRVSLRKQLTAAKESLSTTKERVPPDDAFLAAAALTNPQAAYWAELVKIRRMVLGVVNTPGTERERQAKRHLAFAEEMLRTTLVTGVDPDGLIANPKHTLLREQIVKVEADLALLDAGLELLERAVADEEKNLEDLRVGYGLLEKKRAAIDAAYAERQAALDEIKKHEQILAKLTNQLPVTQPTRAVVPPRPTDPNILVVSLIGSVLGLAAAIGLILLLDLLQGSFKTADDVERGLPVPVLGGMSHLETAEEVLAARAGRRRVSVVAFGFVALVVVVVTIFYVDPTRLPPVVRDLLAMLLGS
jgi:hypothetical protein